VRGQLPGSGFGNVQTVNEILDTSIVIVSWEDCRLGLSRIGWAEIGVRCLWCIQMIASTHINGCVHISGIVSLALHLFIKFLFGVWCPIFFIMKLKFTHYLIFVHASEVFRLSKNLFFRIKFSSLPYLLKRVLIIHMPLIQINRGCDAHHSNHSGHNCIHDGHIVGLLRIHSRSDFWRLGLKIDVFRDFLGRLACNILSSVCSGIQWGGLVGSLIIWLGNVRRCLILLSLIYRHRNIRSVYWERLIDNWAWNIRR